MVLLCEGYTEPANVKFAEVRDELYDDIHEKKQRIEMSRYFSHLREAAAIDNFLAGTSQSPNRPVEPRPAQPQQGLPGPGPQPARLATEGVQPRPSAAGRESAEPSMPRAGSRRAAAAQPAGSGVVPASLEAPVR